jgi:hypothetical protein
LHEPPAGGEPRIVSQTHALLFAGS